MAWPNFTQYNNFGYSADGTKIIAHKYWNIGTGQSFDRLAALNGQTVKPPNMTVISQIHHPRDTAGRIKALKGLTENVVPPLSRTTSESSVTSAASVSTTASDENATTADEAAPTPFTCCIPNCEAAFETEADLQSHLDIGRHQIVVKRVTAYDRARHIWAERAEGADVAQKYADRQDLLREAEDAAQFNSYPKGWARPSARRIQRKTADVKLFLKEIFNEGERTGTKAQPTDVAKLMKTVRNKDGALRFTPDQHLDRNKIASYFQSLSAMDKARKQKQSQQLLDRAENSVIMVEQVIDSDISQKDTEEDTKVIKWLQDHYDSCVEQKKKLKPKSAQHQMKRARTTTGEPMFAPSHWLSQKQFARCFAVFQAVKGGHLNASYVPHMLNVDNQDAQDNISAAIEHMELESTLDECHEQLQLQCPVIFEGQDLCALRKSQHISKLKKSQLVRMLDAHGEDVTPDMEKQQLVAKLTFILQGCACSSTA